jgi:tritrans,polycis-undecaprenyl-diphosphate synthase [geranylgeranyl-diphosphate specific]
MQAKIPKHVAIIMDGNRRWARAQGLTIFDGHNQGKETVKEILDISTKMGIKYLSLWGSSIENLLKRSKKEIDYLMKVYEDGFSDLFDDEGIHKNKIRVRVLGKWRKYLPEFVKKIIYKAIKVTEKYNGLHLTFLLAYSGTSEMLEAVGKIAKKVRNGTMKITNKLIKQNLYSHELPPVDLVIRTGGEPHLSTGFMMWDIKDAQLYFSKKHWPEFDEKELKKAVGEYQKRERRLGI